MFRKKPNLTAHLASQPGRSYEQRSEEQINKEAIRKRLTLVRDARELGNELLDVWEG